MISIDRRHFLETAAVVGVGSALPAPAAPAKPRPNVVLIYTDDQPLSEFNCYGGKVLSPHIDRMAKEGMRFDRFYISSAVCSPSRYSALTGRYACRGLKQQRKCPPGGTINIGWEAGIYGEDGTLPQILQSGGYFTGAVGKWMQGLGGKVKNPPAEATGREPEVAALLKSNYGKVLKSVRNCGFDFAASIYLQNTGVPKGKRSTKKSWLPKVLRQHNQDWVTAGALEFLNQASQREQPFFLYMPTSLTHGPSPLASLRADPKIAASGYLDKAPNVQPSRKDVMDRINQAGLPHGMAGVTWLDDGVGAVFKKLKEMGVTNNTLVILASDNGKRGKFTCYDSGARMPCIMSWPGVIGPGSVCRELTSNIDFAPTFYELAGIKAPTGVVVDGTSLVPLLTGEGTYTRSHLFLEITYERAIVNGGNFKYIATRYPEKIQRLVDAGQKHSHWGLPMDDKVHHTYNAEKQYPGYFDGDQLYDLTKDPGEQHNLARDPAHADMLRKLQVQLTTVSQRLPHRFGEFRK
ncbi:MAG: sulfatase-like hydrolase/transferase [Victivallales bacterium]|jgi:arylsulfatase A-like enzyme|nr:sulfatase-like hydrolase/transferase [Victivallales bacterium]MBT7302943.1 sulfatase-like hydrolase/transferase [Victivallales bacterium]